MERAAAISSERLARRVGEECRVLVDRIEGTVAIARTAGDAPDIDGVVHVRGAKGLRAGEFARVRITAADDYDLQATLVIPP
jgi:ribosomal protein S12 methylthiotransferase